MNPSRNTKNLLWWGRFDPDYSRNGIIRNILKNSGYTLTDFRPAVSALGNLEFRFTKTKRPDAVWVPAFRQRDFNAARRYADRENIPIIFDPLISAWDKAVYERQKFLQDDRRAKKLLEKEQSMFSRADLLLADTPPHAGFFIETLSASPKTVHVVPVGAEEKLFSEQPHGNVQQVEVLFYGSFISLQGPEVITEAARLVPEVQWTMLGNGPLFETCRNRGRDTGNLRFEQWLPYDALAPRIGRASLLLGIFGTSLKAARVIPNKVYQTLACGRPVITRYSEAYPEELMNSPDCGITFIPPGDPEALAEAVRMSTLSQVPLAQRCHRARTTYERYFSEQSVKQALISALSSLGL